MIAQALSLLSSGSIFPTALKIYRQAMRYVNENALNNYGSVCLNGFKGFIKIEVKTTKIYVNYSI